MKLISLSLALAATLQPAPVAEIVQVGDLAPEIEGEWFLSEANTLGALRGRVVLLDFWRTW
ncbi:MAG: hypothetical protein ABGY71_14375 [bacterium]|jgi:hypothetical protein|nr:hypothetical protein [Planctomycetota bacterium]HIL52515.1 hypothetical protein [Planctomycetota bacterium]